MGFDNRLQHLLNRDDVTAYRIWKDTSITKGTITNYLDERTTPNRPNVALLAQYFNVNEEWLMYGTGNKMTKTIEKEANAYLITKAGVKYYQMGDGRYKMRVPLIPTKAYAKYVDECRDADFFDGVYEEYDFIVDKIGHGRYFAFEIKGESMDDNSKRSLSNGDIVLARELSIAHWHNRLNTNAYPNWIIVLENTILCKQIVEHDISKHEIVCHSLNPSLEYIDFNLSLNKIRQLCNIVQRVSSSF